MATEVWLAILISNWEKTRCFSCRYPPLVWWLVGIAEEPAERLCINLKLINIRGNYQPLFGMAVMFSCCHTKSQEAWSRQAY